MQAKRNKVAPVSVLYLFTISRIAVILTSSQSEGVITVETVAAALLAIPATLLLSVPVLVCVRQRKSPLDNRLLSLLYGVYFLYLAVINVYRFSMFSAFALGENLNVVFFGGVILICAAYASALGIEAVSRFAAMAFFMILFCVAAVLALNIGTGSVMNAFPLHFGGRTMLESSALLTLSCSELAAYLCLFPAVNGDGRRCFCVSVAVSLAATFLITAFSLFVFGDGVRYCEYPLFSLFQTATFGGFERLDVLFTSIFCFGIFVKQTLLLYCAGKCLCPKDRPRGAMIAFFLSGIGAYALYRLIGRIPDGTPYFMVPFAVFCVIIPLLTVIFKKKSKGELLIESI